jgi:anti-sigma B factor antagonist
MPDAGFPVETTSGIPVVVTPEEIDITNAPRLRGVLLEAAAMSRGTLVVDMSQTHFCDTAGIHALVSAYKRAQAERGEVLLVITAPAVLRIFAITGLDNVIPHFGSLGEALAAAGIQPPYPGSVNRRDSRA